MYRNLPIKIGRFKHFCRGSENMLYVVFVPLKIYVK